MGRGRNPRDILLGGNSGISTRRPEKIWANTYEILNNSDVETFSKTLDDAFKASADNTVDFNSRLNEDISAAKIFAKLVEQDDDFKLVDKKVVTGSGWAVVPAFSIENDSKKLYVTQSWYNTGFISDHITDENLDDIADGIKTLRASEEVSFGRFESTPAGYLLAYNNQKNSKVPVNEEDEAVLRLNENPRAKNKANLYKMSAVEQLAPGKHNHWFYTEIGNKIVYRTNRGRNLGFVDLEVI